jgi:hypothetical protein
MNKKIKFEWWYKYVPDGQLEPDERGRWCLDCYMYCNIDKSLFSYISFKQIYGKYIPIKVATIHQKGCSNGSVPSVIHKFCATLVSFEHASNLGMSNSWNYFSNDLDEMKEIIENQFEVIKNIFKYCKQI